MSKPSHVLLDVVNQWIQYDPNPQTKEQVQKLLAEEEWDVLSSHFLPRIAFGTAGLRSRMDYGYKNMNELVIVQTTQGFATYLLNTVPTAVTDGVIIGYDKRHNSQKFAEIAANILMAKGIKVYLFEDYVCTPLVPFGVLNLKAAAGIMITASHNPKDDNGYKVYWGNGAQIIPPVDAGISSAIMENLVPWTIPVSIQLDTTNPLLAQAPTVKVIDDYYTSIKETCCFNYEENASSDLRVAYTAMHGVGAKYTSRAFEVFNLPKFYPVPLQVEPDPEFPTVAFPNPEEGAGALKLAMETADEHGCDLILANDPDADRLAVAVRNPTTKAWVILTGNEIAAVLADWSFFQWKKRNPTASPEKCMMVASTVSSKHLQAMANKEGFQFRDTLTGFKWIGNEAINAVNQGHELLVAYEVEIGFIVGSTSFDKDGVRVAAAMYELASYWKKHHGESLLDRIQAFYQKYGFFKMTNSYFFALPPQIDAIMNRLRYWDGNTEGPCNYPTECTPEFPIKSIRDVTKGIDTKFDDKKSVLPLVTDSHMITFTFANGAVATLRNSGTEPKLKFYVECSSPTSEDAEALLVRLTNALIAEFIRPELYSLRRQGE